MWNNRGGGDFGNLLEELETVPMPPPPSASDKRRAIAHAMDHARSVSEERIFLAMLFGIALAPGGVTCE